MGGGGVDLKLRVSVLHTVLVNLVFLTCSKALFRNEGGRGSMAWVCHPLRVTLHTWVKALISVSISVRHLSRVSFQRLTLSIRSLRRVRLSCSSHFVWRGPRETSHPFSSRAGRMIPPKTRLFLQMFRSLLIP